MNNKGLTLIEILIAAIIFALVIIGVIGTFIISIEISKKINYEYTGTNIAKSRLEKARSYMKLSGFDSLTDLSETDMEIDLNNDGKTDFVRSTNIATNYGTKSRLTKVDVEVYYYYKGKKTTVPISMTTVFVDIS